MTAKGLWLSLLVLGQTFHAHSLSQSIPTSIPRLVHALLGMSVLVKMTADSRALPVKLIHTQMKRTRVRARLVPETRHPM